MIKKNLLCSAPAFAAASLLLFSLTGCSDKQQAPTAAAVPEQFVFGDTTFNPENEEPDVNPHNTYSGWAALRYGVGETLFRYDEQMNVQPWLAQSYKLVDDLTWQITLKPGLKFSNGKPVDGAAVKACFENLVAKHPRARGDLKIASIEAKDLTVTIRSSEPRPTLLNYLSDPYGAVVDMSAGVTREGIVVGTGPYVAKKLASGSSLELERNPYYWDGTPGYKRVKVMTISDGDTLTMAMQSGEIDGAYGLPYASHPLFDNDKFFKTSTATSRTFFLHMNFMSPVAKDPAVRKAIALGIDKNRFVNTLLHGNGYVATGPFPSNLNFGGKAVQPKPYDPKEAAKVLDEAGWKDTDGDGIRDKDGRALRIRWLTYPSRQELPLLAEMAQANLKAIGIAVDINSTADHNAVRVKPEAWDVYASAMVTAPTGDPAYFFTSHALKDSVVNNGHYSNPELERLAEELSRTFDPDKRAEIAVRMQQIVLDDDAFVFCSHLKMTMITKSSITGLKAYPADFYEITGALRPKAAQP